MNLSSIKLCSLLQTFHYIKPSIHGTNITPFTLYQEMAALKCSRIVLLSLLSLVVCSAHRTLPNEAGTNHDHMVHSLEDITDTRHAANRHVLNNGGGGGGGGGVASFPTPTSGGAQVVGSAGGYGSGSGHGNDGGHSSGDGGGGGGVGGWGGGLPSFGAPNFGIPGYCVPVGGNSGGYGFGGGYGSGSGGGNENNPPGYGGQPWGIVPPGNEPYHCQPVNCGNPYGCAGLTMYFSHHTRMNIPASNMPESTGHAMAPTESKLN